MIPIQVSLSTMFFGATVFLTTSCVGEIGAPTDTNTIQEEAFIDGSGVPKFAQLSLGELGAPASGLLTLEVRLHNEQYVAEGDMLLQPERVTEVDSLEVPTQGLSLPAAVISATPTWQSGVIPYTIADDIPNTARITNAMAEWSSTTPVRFVKRTGETDYLKFINGAGCASYIGRIGGAQEIWLNDACSTGNTIHEIGHALGMWHEQSRSDRDLFVKILSKNITDGRESNFKTYDQQNQRGVDIGSYNIDSIMHYGSYAFSSNGEPTIVLAETGATFEANREALSSGDIDAINKIYGSPGTGFAPDGKICGGATSYTYPKNSRGTIAQKAQIAHLYCAALDRLPDDGGFRGWVAYLADGHSIETIAYHFYSSVEFRQLHGSNLSNSDFVRLLYYVVLNREPDMAGFRAWVSWLDGGGKQYQAIAGFSESEEFRSLTPFL